MISAKNLEVTRRLLGSSAIVTTPRDGSEISVALDVGGLIRRLLLFDTYILYSVRLKEIPGLVQCFGLQGTLDLLSSGAMEIRCECAQYSEGNFNTPPCPPMTFQFHVLEAHVWEQYLIDCLPELRKTALTGRQLMDLQTAVVKAVMHSDNRPMFAQDVAPAFVGDILSNNRLVKAAVDLLLLQRHGIRNVDNFELKMIKVGDDRFSAETNLDSKLSLSSEETHNIIKRALLGVAGLYQRIGEMKAHGAVSGFTEVELSLFRSKFEALADALGSNRNESRFLRTLSIAGLSDGLGPNQTVDVGRLLKIRSGPEATEFRAWLADIDRLSDADVRDRVASLNAKLGLAAQTTTGKVLRLLATTVAGGIPPLGIALSTLDQFLWDKFFKRSGVAAFINELYPSIFTRAGG
jgi:hypothetical protein